MPELAEVEFYRKVWNPGLRERVLSVELHASRRVFRGTDPPAIIANLSGTTFRDSLAHGKQMLFRFAPAAWLTIHLGMTGKLRVEAASFRPAKHDHLVLRQRQRALVYSDPRQFGRITLHAGERAPRWWLERSPAPNEPGFTLARVTQVLQRHRKLPIKAALLLQDGFPGIGNWMADEILWQSRLLPTRPVASLSAAEQRALWKSTRAIVRTSLRTIGVDFSDPPGKWLFHRRWSRAGHCPRHDGTVLHCATVGGRTTVWCSVCQR